MTFHVLCCGCYKGKIWEKLVYGPFYIISVPLYAICTSTKSLFCPDRKEKERKSELSSDIKKLESEKLDLDEKLKSKSWSKEEQNEYDRIKIELREKNYQIKRKDTSEENSEKATYLKLAEVLCESIPQVVLQCFYFVEKGFPWSKYEGDLKIFDDFSLFWNTWIPFFSSITSAIMIIIGVFSGIFAFVNVRRYAKLKRQEERDLWHDKKNLKTKKDTLLNKRNCWDTEDENEYKTIIKELSEKKDYDQLKENDKIENLRKKRSSLKKNKKRNKKEEEEYERAKEDLRDLCCFEMREDDKRMALTKNKKKLLETIENRSKEDNEEYDKAKEEIRIFGCKEMKKEDTIVKDDWKRKLELEKIKNRSDEEENEHEEKKKELRKYGFPKMRESDNKMDELSNRRKQLKEKENRTEEEEQEYERTKKQLRRLGCREINKEVEELNKKIEIYMATENRRAEEEKDFEKIKDELRRLGYSKMIEYDKEIKRLQVTKSKLEKERNVTEDETYKNTMTRLRKLGCATMKKHDIKVEELRQKKLDLETLLTQEGQLDVVSPQQSQLQSTAQHIRRLLDNYKKSTNKKEISNIEKKLKILGVNLGTEETVQLLNTEKESSVPTEDRIQNNPDNVDE
jgi:hypothetical protein